MGRRKKNKKKGNDDDFWDAFPVEGADTGGDGGAPAAAEAEPSPADGGADNNANANANNNNNNNGGGKKKKNKKNKKKGGNANNNNANANANANKDQDNKTKTQDDKTKDTAPAQEAKAGGGKAGGKKAGGKKGKKGKKGGPSKAMIAKIKAQKEAKAREEAERKAREEEERRLAEEEAKAEEEELERRRKQAEEDKAKAMANREAQAAAAAKAKAAKRRQELIDQGLIDPAVLEQRMADEEARSGKKKKILYVDHKKKKRKEAEAKAKAEAEAKAKAEAEAAAASGSDTPDDWDADSMSSVSSDFELAGVAKADGDDNGEAGSGSGDAKSGDAAAAAAASASDGDSDGDDEEAGPASGDYRSPIIAILGHVDVGKTKLLDKIRRTNVQNAEAGGITQQIGATFFPDEAVKRQTDALTAKKKMEMLVPGLLIIDTPGHESFTNLRSRGSSLCDIAVLVVDLMHGLEPQTLESIELLKQRKTPFVVALNKVDRCYGWNSPEGADKARIYQPFKHSYKNQDEATINEFKQRSNDIIVQFAEEGLNARLYYENEDFKRNISMVPTSAHTGEGIPDLLLLLVQLTQKMMGPKLFLKPEMEATVLEIKQEPGLGSTIDVILVNGEIHEGDEIVVCGMDGPIVTKIRALLTPHPMKELRVRSPYIHHKTIKAAQGLKIAAPDLEGAVAGTSLYVVGPDDDVEELQDAVMSDMESILTSVDGSGEGVYVKASTLGSLEALLVFLKGEGVPVMGVSVGNIRKKDINKAAIMLDRKPKYAVILAFNVTMSTEVAQYAAQRGVGVMQEEIIYRLFEDFKRYMDVKTAEEKEAFRDLAIFPCIANTIQVINKKNPLVLGIEVEDGRLHIGSRLCIPSRGNLSIGTVIGMQVDGVDIEEATGGMQVAVKFDSPHNLQIGRQFSEDDKLFSQITRETIDVLKNYYRDEMTKPWWKLTIKLKKLFGIL